MSVPFIVFQGEKDPICSKSQLIQLLKSCNLDEVNLKVFKDGGHDIQLGAEKGNVHACTLNWIKSNMVQAVPLGAIPSEANKRAARKRNISILKVVILLFVYFKGLQVCFN